MMGLCRAEVRLPLIPLNREKQEALAQVMRKMKLISA
jgi:dihydrodipicolinate synthase/N-acetylneuraminate lyase